MPLDLTQIASAYRLVDITVRPDQLMLDPNNPRVVLSAKNIEYSPNEIASDRVQLDIQQQLMTTEHHVSQLVSGIRSRGFIAGMHEIIVEPLDGHGAFLVLEGNRRTLAIRELLTRPDDLPPHVAQSLQTIQVKKFVHDSDSSFSRDEVVDVLLASVHIDGPQEWGPMHKARYMYHTYCRELSSNGHRARGPQFAFRYDRDVAVRVGTHFNQKPGLVRQSLAIYRVYDQLRQTEYPVSTRHYSLLEMSIRLKSMCHEVFGLDNDTLRFSTEGMEHFFNLCLADNSTINNPPQMRALDYVLRNGTENEINLILIEKKDPNHIKNQIKTREGRREFYTDLLDIEDRINQLRVAKHQGTKQEDKAIRRIHDAVKRILLPLKK